MNRYQIMYFISFLLSLLPMFYMIFQCYKDQFRLPKAVNLCIFGGIYFLYFICIYGFFISTMKTQLYHLLTWGMCLILILIYIFFCLKGSFFQNLFLLFMAENIYECVCLFIRVYGNMLLGDGSAMKMYVIFGILDVIIVAVVLPALWACCKYVLRPLMEDTEHLSFWKFFWMIPLIFNGLYQEICPVYFDRTEHLLEGFRMFPVFWSCCILGLYVILFKLITTMLRRSRLENSVQIYQVETKMQQEKFRMMQSNMEAVRELRHDTRHLMVMLRGLCEKGDYRALGDALDKYIEKPALRPEDTLCANYGLDSILRYYRDMALGSGTRVDIHVKMDTVEHIPENDLCLVVGNLFENACEACRRMMKAQEQATPVRNAQGPACGGQQPDASAPEPNLQPWISVDIHTTSGRMIAIRISNSYTGTLRPTKEGFLSSKRTEEGIGLVSVRHILEKNHGLINIKKEDNVFCAEVLMNLIGT